jgi:glutamine synthetase
LALACAAAASVAAAASLAAAASWTTADVSLLHPPRWLLDNALDALQHSTALRQALGPRLCDLFVGIKHHEHAERAACTDPRGQWDMRYLIELA